MKFIITGLKDGHPEDDLLDVTLFKEYEVFDKDDDGDYYFIDDAGDNNYAVDAVIGAGVVEVITQ